MVKESDHKSKMYIENVLGVVANYREIWFLVIADVAVIVGGNVQV